MNKIPSQRKNHWSLDVAKFLCAILIISAHFAAESGKFPTLIDYCFSIYIIAVPFFFACSGFLFFKKWLPLDTENRKKYFISYQKRIWIMYGCWSAVYVSWLVIKWIKNGVFGLEKILDWLHTALVFQTYSTIWFLPALAVGIAISCFLISHFSKKTVLVVSAILYVIGMLGYTYSFLLEGTVFQTILEYYLLVFKTIRNGLFNAVPCIMIGFVFVKREVTPNRKGFAVNALLASFSLVLLVVEAFVLKLKFSVTGMDIAAFIVPFTYFFIKALLCVDLKENKLWLWCRKLSLLIFVSQRLFLTVLPEAFPEFFAILFANSYLGLLLVIGFTLGFSVLLIKLSEKVKFLKCFM